LENLHRSASGIFLRGTARLPMVYYSLLPQLERKAEKKFIIYFNKLIIAEVREKENSKHPYDSDKTCFY
jgi:hypothetical protein